ncbi:MAG: FIST C-terminal domain-containing protein [Planctomycetaceae bacterium]|nr:FIST C-terminal domain-containing protein [Planctomycetaceae bacterium]
MADQQSSNPRFAAALSTASEPLRAATEVASAAHAQLGVAADLGFLFVSAQFAGDIARIAARVVELTGVRCLLGATGESIVGGELEIEEAPAVSLWLARLPHTRLLPLRLEFERSPEGGVIVGWPDELSGDWPAGATLLLLAEPFSFPADYLLERLNADQPGVQVLGGMASGGWEPGQNRLVDAQGEFDSGAIGVLIDGGVRVRSVGSQGCRPVGRHFVITKAERNVIHELSGRPALERLQEVYRELTEADQALVRQGLHVGRVMNEYQEDFQRGDFLVRNVIGADNASGAIAIGDFVKAGQTVQFNVRDAATADEDLRDLLRAGVASSSGVGDRGALLFTCNGRGSRLFDQPHHDARLIQELAGPLPLAGFFAQGEIGPVAGKNFVHGFTASVALFEAV